MDACHCKPHVFAAQRSRNMIRRRSTSQGPRIPLGGEGTVEDWHKAPEHLPRSALPNTRVYILGPLHTPVVLKCRPPAKPEGVGMSNTDHRHPCTGTAK